MEIPAGAQVQHTCDVRPCVNPAHLKLGTPADNTADMMVRGRGSAGRGGARPQIRRFGPTEWGQRRAASRLSLRDLERLTGINRGYLSMLERGRYLPTPDETRKILDALDGATAGPVE